MSGEQTHIPPNSQESEYMVLGCMLTSTNSLNIAAGSLEENDFYYSENKLIFSVLKGAHKHDKPADVHLVCEELKRQGKLDGIGGPSFVAGLAQYAGTSAYIERYIEIVRGKSLSRQAISLSRETIDKFLLDPVFPEKELISTHQCLIELGKRYSPSDKASLGEVLSGTKLGVDSKSIIERIKERKDFFDKEGKPFLTGIPTGFRELDDNVTLLEDTHFVIIAGRPAMGKTALGLNIANQVSIDQQIPVGFISLEMGANRLAERILSMRTKVAGERIKRGALSVDELEKLVEEEKGVKTAPLFIHDTAVASVYQVIARARRLKDEEDIGLLIIDYLGLLGTGGNSDSRQYEVAEVSRSLKMLAMELHIPIICIAQLSRGVESRADKKPLISDLRDSGQIEQDADAIVFVFREDYYDPGSKPGQVEVIVAKNRHGPTLSASLAFKSECGLFSSLESIQSLGATVDFNS